MTAQREALLITPAFFGYERDILSELVRHGYATTLLDERPSNSALARAVMRVRKSLIGRRIDAYYRAKQDELAGAAYDLVVVIKAEVVPPWFLQSLRTRHPSARFVFYTYDSLSNAGNCLDVLDCFDELLSFDRDDVASRPDFAYLPLFFTSEYTPLGSADRRHSLSFIGTLHSGRYSFAQALFAGIPSTFGFFFVQARWYFVLVKYLTREHRQVPWRDVSFSPLGRAEIAKIFRESRAVIDVQRAGQAGLTMRTFEVLASGSILVTTNQAITREPFYDPERILVVTSDPTAPEVANLHARLAGLSTPLSAPSGFDAYSVSNFVGRLVGPRES